MNGTQPKATKLSRHEKMKPIVIPQINAAVVSKITERPSVLAPLTI
jgi:hypothetical protein